MSLNREHQKTKTMSITSGKGGVGKTMIVCNLAWSLAQKGKRVLILDGDLGLANVEIHFGVRVTGHIGDLLLGRKPIENVICSVDQNIDLLSGGSGVAEVNRIGSFERRQILEFVSQIDRHYDYLLIDTAPGISDHVLHLNSAVQAPVVVINSDPSSFADSYALIKVMNQDYKDNRFSIICNQVKDETDGLVLYQRFSDVVTRFLNIGLDYWGSVPLDPAVRKSTQNQRLILKHEPENQAAKALASISNKLESSMIRNAHKSGLQFFWDQVIGVA